MQLIFHSYRKDKKQKTEALNKLQDKGSRLELAGSEFKE